MALFDRKDNKNDTDNISYLISALGSKDWKLRQEAAVGLAQAGKPALIPLLKSLDSDNAMIRSGAAEVLGAYGEIALPTLLKLIVTGKENVRDGAARAIGQNGETALKPLEEALKNKNYKSRRGAALALGYLGYLGPNITGLLVGALEDQNDEVRLQAAKSLENINWKPANRHQAALYYYATDDTDSLAKSGRDAIHILKSGISTGNTARKRKIAQVLSKINEEESLILLVKLLEDEQPEVRQAAAEALGNAGDRRVWQFLVKALDDHISYVRVEAAWSLDRTGWKPSDNDQKAKYLMTKERWAELVQMREAALPVLISSLKDDDNSIRLKSTEVLRAMGNVGYAAINEALKSDDPKLKRAAAHAVAHIKQKNAEAHSQKPKDRPKSPEDEIEEQIKRQKASMAKRDSKSEEFWAAILRKNNVNEERVLRLSKALSDENEIIRSAAVENLKSLGSAGTECILHLLADKKNNVKIAAIEALGDLKVKKAAPYILKLSGDKNENIRMACAHSLGQIKEPKTIPGLIKLFSDNHTGVRKEASHSISEIGSITLPFVKKAFDEADITVRITAIDAVSGIRDPVSISLTVRMLNDSEYDVRISAIKALTNFSEYLFNPLMDEALRVSIRGNFMEKTGMISALSEIEDLRAKEAIAAFASDQDNKIKSLALSAIKSTQETEDPGLHKKLVIQKQEIKEEISEIDRIISGLKSDDNTVQMKAAEQVFMMGNEIIEPLIASLDENNPSFQNIVAEILIGLGDPAIKGLIKALKTGSTAVKIIAAQNLGKIPEDETINALCDVLYSETNPEVRIVAAESLGFTGDKRAVDALIFASADENTKVRASAIRSLGYSGDKKAIPTLIKAFEEDDTYIAKTATDSLKNIGSDATDALVNAIKSGDGAYKLKIAHALDAMAWVPETEEAITYYLIAKRNWNEIERIGTPAIAPLSELTDDSDIDTRLGAVNAIAKIGGTEAIPPLSAAISDISVMVRKKAECALIEIGDPAVPYLEEIVASTNDPTKRTFAMNLIRKIKS
ncbi:hypothetical protein F1737_07575 [Methanoplanus sp. FWC-SCC4]|uniref:PBS lyase n=1 Tax=Methanochimaera problematica TaxID=2609417 RepID=A0AA97I4N9_9EURY|nr:HEAT repeat domain-containing protein [Methanoplanus sp. FWC-SCC4]WOF16561.1 hypothetical protein F1737_07575 [Methanoplanus sp. FWC-SCC4]